ncbi:aminotransferase class I/II-fold pyridoxal phosphate-dependent enzyme [Alienimonas californiensis]|uniref:Arginine decarboxylase n=1 Tax=Alienimonas californiensis TaxID=2527989 RepID=A0A517PDL3_9PLAN|nr:aminotransferase class I/II-fold pyridoxal phosphate-dependent enzyme [Alienimonas californiensis]QDT17421.1 Arginine decarboxylase [Alienimonas californiensis]
MSAVQISGSREPADRAPLLDALLAYADRGVRGLHTPGHKSGRFAPPRMLEALGPAAFRLDLPAMGVTDNTFHPRGCLAEAERLAADLYEASATRFLAGGATLGIIAGVLAAVPEGDSLLLSRIAHRSAFSALALSGATPRYLMPRSADPAAAAELSPADVAHHLDADPRIRALLLTRPSYYGVAASLDVLREVAALCRRRGVLTIVDEAHGGHFKFLPAGRGPGSAVDAPVDLVIQSPHKTLGALVGGAWAHFPQESRLDPDRFAARMNLLQTTSPSNLVLASLDAARQWLHGGGRNRFPDAVPEVAALRAKLAALPGVRLSGASRDPEDFATTDPFRLAVDVSETGADGPAVERVLRERRIEHEFCDRTHVVFVLGPGDDRAAWDDLIDTFAALPPGQPGENGHGGGAVLPEPLVRLSPRRAASLPTESVPRAGAAGRIAGEVIAVYPPGIPLACPGEEVTAEVLRAADAAAAAGLSVHAADSTLKRILVLAD